jgi:hypothetical protein
VTLEYYDCFKVSPTDVVNRFKVVNRQKIVFTGPILFKLSSLGLTFGIGFGLVKTETARGDKFQVESPGSTFVVTG